MLGKLIRLYINIGLKYRYYLWKIILTINGGQIGKNVRIYSQVKLVSHKGRPIRIGDNVTILQGVIISTAESGRFNIGNDVYIGEYSVLASNEEIIIEDDVLIAPHNNIVDFDHRFKYPEISISKQGFEARRIVIKKGAWIACNCCILKGVTIGEGSVIGAGSVVSKDVPPYSIAVRNSAMIIRRGGKNE